jgi:hypothetical protein
MSEQTETSPSRQRIVDEARELERVSAWNDPEEFANAASQQYRRDFWSQQPERCEVWSEKGTLRGVLAPVLDQYGIGFWKNTAAFM